MFDIISDFENKFVYQSAKEWAQKYWTISIYASIFYVISIFSIQRFMKDRPPFDLRRWLFAWSLMLSLFSMVGFYHTGPTVVRLVQQNGLYSAVCKPHRTELVSEGFWFVDNQKGMWGMLFTISKLVELIDTYFIVLRKQKLIFLHWYHHITVLTYTWYYYGPGGTPFSHQLFMMMNYFVHSIMYMYYAVRASGIYRPPKWVNLFITSLQLVQMVCGTAGMLYILTGMLYTPDFYCDGVTETSYGYPGWALAMYGSYFILFLYFFYNSYIKKDSTRDRPASNGINDRRKTHQPRGTSGSPSLHVNGVNNNNNNNNSPLDKDKSE